MEYVVYSASMEAVYGTGFLAEGGEWVASARDARWLVLENPDEAALPNDVPPDASFVPSGIADWLAVVDGQCWDGVFWHECGTLWGLYSKAPLSEKAGVQVISNEAYLKLALEKAVTGFEPSSEEQYMDALDALPPLEWHHNGPEQSFRLGECYTFDVYGTHVRIKEGDCWRYFYAYRRIGEPHAELVQQCKALLGQKEAA